LPQDTNLLRRGKVVAGSGLERGPRLTL